MNTRSIVRRCSSKSAFETLEARQLFTAATADAVLVAEPCISATLYVDLTASTASAANTTYVVGPRPNIIPPPSPVTVRGPGDSVKIGPRFRDAVTRTDLDAQIQL